MALKDKEQEKEQAIYLGNINNSPNNHFMHFSYANS